MFPILSMFSGTGWRANTPMQKQRNKVQFFAKSNERTEFLQWAKKFMEDPLGYNKFLMGEYKLPNNNFARALALGYVSDISEVKRLHNDEGISVEWTPIPMGFSEEEWNTGISRETPFDNIENEE